jgi:uncharacterized iron-regulated protein
MVGRLDLYVPLSSALHILLALVQMRYSCVLLLATAVFVQKSTSAAQLDPKPQDATAAILHAFETHNIVIIGETHGNKQEYEWLRSLVGTPEFADRVDDIVMELGNSLYQKSVDRYIAGEDVPIEQVQKAWRNTVGSVGPPSPVSAWLYAAVRETNMKRRDKHQIRVLCGDPYIDWDKVKTREDIEPYLSHRDEWFTEVVKDDVLAKHRRALLIMGSGHFLRGMGPKYVEPHLRMAGAKTYLIVFGTNVIGGYDDLDHRFDSWPAPVIVPLADNWVGELPALSVVSGGQVPPHGWMFRRGSKSPVPDTRPAPVKLRAAADALLYLGPRDSLIGVSMTRAELDGTPYGKEVQRRLKIEGFSDSFSDGAEKAEGPQFSRPQTVGGAPPPPLPPPPKNVGAPLPPRPPSQ